MDKPTKMNEDMLIWRKHFKLNTTNNLEQCLSVLQHLDDEHIGFFKVTVVIHQNDDKTLKFHIKSRTPRVSAWVFGAVAHDQKTEITGTAGIDPSVLLIAFMTVLILPIVYLSLSEPTPKAFIVLILIISLTISALIGGGIMIRNKLITELQERFP